MKDNLEDSPNLDDLYKDPEVQVSQILQRVFLLGLICGKNQLMDDASAGSSPMASVLAQLQQQFDQLSPGTKQAAEFNTSINKTYLDNIHKSENQKKQAEKIKIQNDNLTSNDKRLNAQHDVIVKDLMDSLEEEMKQSAANIVKETKNLK
jgi:outer membrane murein-binding lipoprotein Lpp